MEKISAIIIVVVICAISVVALAFAGVEEIADIVNFFQDEKDDYKLEARIMVDRNEVYVNENITFNAANSTGDIIDWLWDFGDGNVSKEPVVLHGYASSKYYNVYLTVKDKKGNKDIESITVKINNRNYFDESSGQIIMTPRGGVSTGDSWLYFPVYMGTSNATIFANWSLQSNGALISIYLEDCEYNTLYSNSQFLTGTLDINEVFNEFENYGEDYYMSVWCYSGNLYFAMEVSVCY